MLCPGCRGRPAALGADGSLGGVSSSGSSVLSPMLTILTVCLRGGLRVVMGGRRCDCCGGLGGSRVDGVLIAFVLFWFFNHF